jgi:hypothetical protein
LGDRVWDLGFRVWGLGFRVDGSGTLNPEPSPSTNPSNAIPMQISICLPCFNLRINPLKGVSTGASREISTNVGYMSKGVPVEVVTSSTIHVCPPDVPVRIWVCPQDVTASSGRASTNLSVGPERPGYMRTAVIQYSPSLLLLYYSRKGP